MGFGFYDPQWVKCNRNECLQPGQWPVIKWNLSPNENPIKKMADAARNIKLIVTHDFTAGSLLFGEITISGVEPMVSLSADSI